MRKAERHIEMLQASGEDTTQAQQAYNEVESRFRDAQAKRKHYRPLTLLPPPLMHRSRQSSAIAVKCPTHTAKPEGGDHKALPFFYLALA